VKPKRQTQEIAYRNASGYSGLIAYAIGQTATENWAHDKFDTPLNV